jgi:hypothetical protein
MLFFNAFLQISKNYPVVSYDNKNFLINFFYFRKIKNKIIFLLKKMKI